MGKMIAVCGAPGSGKTTAALKIAEEIYYAKKGSVIFLSPDLNVPCLAFVFPNCKEEGTVFCRCCAGPHGYLP